MATSASSLPLMIERLLDPAAYPHSTAAIHLVETHISWVILTGPFAYKVKKPVTLGFVDYGTLELRRRSCAGEVRVSGRFAPELYVAAVPITGSPESPHVGGDGEPIEWAVKLVQFDETDRLDARFEAGRLTATDCRALGEAIAAVEERLPVAEPDTPWGTGASVLAAAAINIEAIQRSLPEVTGRVAALDRWLRERLTAHERLLGMRKSTGRVRECHGDLHLANLVLHEARMTPFDAIEFNENLRWIDVANDVAFLSMDLEARGRPDLAAQVVSSWIEAANDHNAATLMPVYEAYRAVVRCSIAAIRAGQGCASSRAEAVCYLDLAERLTRRGRPVAVVTSGVSGSGKSTVAAELVGALPAMRVRSDVERKRLAGMGPTERPADAAAEAVLYGDALTRRVYERLAVLAATLLDAGVSVVIDAACTKRWQRDILSRVAVERGVPIVWVAFDLPTEAALTRIAARQARGDDPSDATADVVRWQVASFEPIGEDETSAESAIVRVAAAHEPESVAERVVRARDRLMGEPR